MVSGILDYRHKYKTAILTKLIHLKLHLSLLQSDY